MAKAKTTSESSTSDLEVQLALFRSLQNVTEARARDRAQKIQTLRNAQGVDEQTLCNVRHSIARTQNALFARGAIPEEVRKSRSALLAKVERAKSDRITVATVRTLESEIVAHKDKLQALCAHPFVFSYDGYGGSHCMDRDDARRGHRVCMVCNQRETSAGTKEDVYSILPEDTTRLVRRDLRKESERPKRWRAEEWFHLDFLAQLFEHSAWSINVEWQNDEEKQPALVA